MMTTNRWAALWKMMARAQRNSARDWEYHHNDLQAGLDDVNAVLTAAGIPSAKWAACDDPACQTQTGHRVRQLVKGSVLMRKALEAVVTDEKEDPCYYDHHGNCQAHALQPKGECCMELARAALRHT